MQLQSAFLLLVAVPSAGASTCRPIKDIYTNGRELCEKMWDNSFQYSTDTNAYTMWWFSTDNPNNDVSTAIGHSALDTCSVSNAHTKATPTSITVENHDFKECHPWAEGACCHESTVVTPDKLNNLYGPEYHWNRCGPISQACERFYVQEACFYECDVNLGHYRKCDDSQVAAAVYQTDGVTPCTSSWDPGCGCFENTWQIENMPIQAAYCDAFYEACYDDLFCGSGSFFDCPYDPPTAAPSTRPAKIIEHERNFETMTLVAIIAGLVALVCACLVGTFCYSESKGKMLMYNQFEESRAPNVEMKSRA
jgi:folate receptor